MRMLGKRVAMTLGSVSIAAMMTAPVAAKSLDASDMAFAFGGKAAPSAITRTAKAAAPKAMKPVVVASARTMTTTEMKDTEGAWGPWGAILGGVSGGLGYGASCMQTRSCTLAGFGAYTAGGAVLGAISGPIGITRAYTYKNASIILGVGFGQGTKRGWW